MLPFIKLFVVLIGLGCPGVSKESAKDVEFKKHLQWAKENLAATQKKIADLQKEESQDSSCLSKKCLLKSLQAPTLETDSVPETNEKILIFVSFSMPEASLKSLAQEAVQQNAVLILRGLVEDSFKKTAECLKDYAQGMEINPDLFEKHAIHHTPTFVRVKETQEQSRLSGNVTLKFAAQKLAEAS